MGQRDEEDLFDQRRAQRVHRLLDQRRAVVERHDPHAGWKAGLDLGDARLDASNHRVRVAPVRATTTPPTASCVPFTSDATRKASPDLDVGDLVDVHRHAVRRRTTIFEVVDGLHQADASHDQPGPVRLDDVAADVEIAVADGGNHRARRQAVGLQPVRIDVDLILLHHPADGGDFGHTRNGIELIADEPVLKAPKLAQGMASDSRRCTRRRGRRPSHPGPSVGVTPGATSS